jgi:hypothetical protein
VWPPASHLRLLLPSFFFHNEELNRLSVSRQASIVSTHGRILRIVRTAGSWRKKSQFQGSLSTDLRLQVAATRCEQIIQRDQPPLCAEHS